MGIVNIESGDGEVIRIVRDGERVVEEIYHYRNRFWALATLKRQCEREFEISECDECDVFGNKLIELKCNNSSDRSFTFPEKSTFERDVPLRLKYAIEKNIEFDSNIRILFLDIETDMCKDASIADKPITVIGTKDSFTKKKVAFVWRKDLKEGETIEDGVTYFCFNDEKSMILNFFVYFRENQNRVDVITAWNLSFDVPYIINRCKALCINENLFSPLNFIIKRAVWCSERESQYNKFGDVSLTFKIAGIMCIDLLKLYRKITVYNVEKADSFKLDDVARFVLNENKLVLNDMHAAWIGNIRSLLNYNSRDVDLIYNLEEKLKLIGGYLAKLQQITSAPLDVCMSNAQLIDFNILKTFKNKYHFPSKQARDSDALAKVKFEGAFVLKPELKLFTNVAVFDFSGMYPNIMRTFNISPETKVDEKFEGKRVCCDNCHIFTIHRNAYSVGWKKIEGSDIYKKVYFRMDKTSIFSRLISKMIDARYFYKNKWLEMEKEMLKYEEGSKEYNRFLLEKTNWHGLEDAQKALVNSFFGTMGYENFRFYDVELGGSVTGFGRTLVAMMKEIVESVEISGVRFRVIYQDTDSCFVVPASDVSFENFRSVCEKLNKKINDELSVVIAEKINPYYDVEKRTMSVEIAYFFKSLLFTGVKKRYVGMMVKGEKEVFYARGFELIKKDTPAIFKKKLKEIFVEILNLKEEKEIYKKMKSIYNEMSSFEKKSFGIPKNFSKKISDYHNNPQHVRALLWSNKNLNKNYDSTDNVKMFFVKVNKSKYENTDVMMLDTNEEFPSDVEIDVDKYFDFFFVRKIKSVFASCDRDAVFGKVQAKLGDFL